MVRHHWANSIAVQSDGKIVTAGGGYGNFQVARLNRDGSRDSNFGENGIVTTSFGADVSPEAFGVAIQPDGKIVAAGCASDGSGCALDSRSDAEFAVARYHPDGSLDETFGDGGKVTTRPAPSPNIAYGVVVQSNGRIVAGGVMGGGGLFGLAGYRSDGSLDPTFGECATRFSLVCPSRTGFFAHGFPGNPSASGFALTSQPDDKLVLAGDVGDASAGDIGVARYSADGRLDESFSGDGRATMNTDSSYRAAEGVAIQPDGKPVAVGGTQAFGPTGDFVVGRFTAGGEPDGSFGTSGKTLTDFSGRVRSRYDKAAGVAIQSDGKIVVAGPSWGGLGDNYRNNSALARYLPNGALDSSFGSDGKVLSIPVEPNDVALQRNGKILVAGRGGVARYLAGRPAARSAK